MARAKQTNRADARRRYRQVSAQSTLVESDELSEDGATTATPQPGRQTTSSRRPQPAATPSGRLGMGAAFRLAYRKAQYREDLAALPELIRGRWFLIALALVVLGGIGAIAVPSTITVFAFQTLTVPPAMIPIFLVGFTAPRASYLLGFLVGIVDTIIYAITVSLVVGSDVANSASLSNYLLTAVTFGLPASVLFSAGAAWYRRFLALSSGRQPQKASNRSKNGSRGGNRR